MLSYVHYIKNAEILTNGAPGKLHFSRGVHWLWNVEVTFRLWADISGRTEPHTQARLRFARLAKVFVALKNQIFDKLYFLCLYNLNYCACIDCYLVLICLLDTEHDLLSKLKFLIFAILSSGCLEPVPSLQQHHTLLIPHLRHRSPGVKLKLEVLEDAVHENLGLKVGNLLAKALSGATAKWKECAGDYAALVVGVEPLWLKLLWWFPVLGVILEKLYTG